MKEFVKKQEEDKEKEKDSAERCREPREAMGRQPDSRRSRSCQDEGEEKEGSGKVLAAATERGRLEEPRASRQYEDVESTRKEQGQEDKRTEFLQKARRKRKEDAHVVRGQTREMKKDSGV
ncbi:hypothetical protein B9Z55_016077 [Caenorhabditis nigoni]|uniref:Uncharacterized protein n=1 Tax=Caenorhabditis nigoni TaxID=1611254 RepID=A0A2G5UDM7_9PELO|nr:hypothetical protein B9Z55_016077 [Caenorhabditis nigoni]